MRPILVCNTRGTKTPLVYALTMNSLTQIGNDPGLAVETATVTGTPYATRRVCFYRGSLYWLIRDKVLRLNPIANTWNTVYTISNLNALLQNKSGLYIFNRGRTQCLGFAYETTTADTIGFAFTADGETWTTPPLTVVSANGFSDTGSSEIFFNNKVFKMGDSPGSTLLDFDAMAAANIDDVTTGTTASNSGPFIYRNMPMAINQHSDGRTFIVAYIGTAYNYILQIGTGASFNANAKPCGFIDGDFFYAVYWDTGQWNIKQFKVRFDYSNLFQFNVNSDITSTVFSGLNFTTALTTWRVVYDNNVAPGQNPQIYLAVSDGGLENTVIDWYRWRGPSQTLEGIGSIGDGFMALPDCNQYGGGEYFWETNRIDSLIEKVSAGSSLGKLKLWYRLVESTAYPSGTSAQVGFVMNKGNNSESPPATGLLHGLSSPSAGVISSNGSFIGGVPIGSGTLHSVEWDWRIDGVPKRTGAFIVPFASGT
jgi:hypothetical protein